MSESREQRCTAASSIIAKSLLDAEGFAIVPGVLDQSAIAELIQAVQDQLS
jgi:hypothetical protein